MNTNLPAGESPNPNAAAPHRSRQLPSAIPLPDGSEILNKAEVARRLGVTERHIEHLIKMKRIPHLRLGRKALRFVWSDVIRDFAIRSIES